MGVPCTGTSHPAVKVDWIMMMSMAKVTRRFSIGLKLKSCWVKRDKHGSRRLFMFELKGVDAWGRWMRKMLEEDEWGRCSRKEVPLLQRKMPEEADHPVAGD
jgi:hypothetical protein